MSAQKLEERYQAVMKMIAEKSGCEKYLRPEDGSLILAGTIEEPLITLLIAPQENGYYYGITVGGEGSSYESADFPTDDDCAEAAAEFVSQFMGKTVRFTRIQKRFSYIYESYQVQNEETQEWITVSENYLDRFLLKCFLWKNVSEEWETTFSIS